MSESFTETYLVTYNADTAQYTISVHFPSDSNTYADTADGTNDGQVAPGALIQNTEAGVQETYVGMLAGNGILTQYNGAYYLATNDATLQPGQVLTIDPGVYTFCFLPGSLIATPAGEVAVESLSIGDLVTSADGRAVPVRWIGRQTVRTALDIADRLLPIRFAAGSLGAGVPHTDLLVTPDHGMLVGDVICHAGALVNGETITRVPRAEVGRSYIAYHIETEAHEIILANGAPAETFIDNVSRKGFDNYAEFMALYPNAPDMAELDYPRAMSARQVPPRIRDLLAPPKVA